MDVAFRDIRATQVDMTQLPEQDASSDVTKFESWRGHRISWAYGIETKGSESLGVRYSEEFRGRPKKVGTARVTGRMQLITFSWRAPFSKPPSWLLHAV